MHIRVHVHVSALPLYIWPLLCLFSTHGTQSSGGRANVLRRVYRIDIYLTLHQPASRSGSAARFLLLDLGDSVLRAYVYVLH